MRILVVGGGGREHTLAWKIAQSDLVDEVIVAPGNAGIAKESKCKTLDVSASDIHALRDYAIAEKIDLTVVGPEDPLVSGLADLFEDSGLKVFGPSAKAAQLEGSKAFTNRIMKQYGVPSPEFAMFEDYGKACEHVRRVGAPIVVKADGLAAGKGVFVCRTEEEALSALDDIMEKKVFGDAGNQAVIEECLVGEEASFIAFADGKTVLPLASSQDHKPVFDEDQGPNTGGMGAYSPAPVVTPEIHDMVMSEIMVPVVKAMEAEGAPYVGFLYAGIMIADNRPKVLEFNARMGDPEAQPLLFRMKSDLVPLMLAACERRLSDMSIEWEPEDSVCVVMASGGYPGSYGKGKPITGIEAAESVDGVKVFHAGTKADGQGFVTNGGRVLGVTAKAVGIAKAIEKAYDAVEKIKWDGVHFRKDIGKKALDRA